MDKTISWKMYRDDSNQTLPKKLATLVSAYKEKMGKLPTAIGLPPGYSEETIRQLGERFEVQVAVPRWAKHEIWLGVVAEK